MRTKSIKRKSYGATAFWIACLFMLTMVNFGCGGGGGGSDSPQQFTTEYAHLRYRVFESGTNDGYRGVIGLADNGGPIQDTDVTDVVMTDPSSSPVAANDEGFFSFNYFLYDCSGGSCVQSGPVNDSCIWATFDSLIAGVYHTDVTMDNGQTLSVDVDYPGQTSLPIIASASLSVDDIGGDLVLNWSNPTVAEWSLVSNLRIQIIDDGSPRTTVLCIDVPASAESVTIPASLVAEAENLGSGTLDLWRVQARAYDANNMNYARSYSNYVPVAQP